MAGTPSKHTSRVIRDFGKPRQFLRDARAKAARNLHSKSTRRP